MKVGRLEFFLRRRLPEDGEPLFSYVSWCYPSETIFFLWWELNIQNRRKSKYKYGNR